MKSTSFIRTRMNTCLWGSGMLLLGTFLLLGSCNGENVPDCFQNAGESVRRTLDVPEFNNITVFENLNLVLKQGDQHKVEVESGEYLIEGISAQVDEGRLILRNDTSCNFVRKYGLTRSEEHTSELQSRENLVCRLLLEKKNTNK